MPIELTEKKLREIEGREAGELHPDGIEALLVSTAERDALCAAARLSAKQVEAINDLRTELATSTDPNTHTDCIGAYDIMRRERDELRAEAERLKRECDMLIEGNFNADAKLTALRRVAEAASQFGSGGDWGTLKAWIVEGASDRADGIAAARLLTGYQVTLDAALAEWRAGEGK
jgi:hypothetical protein